MSLFPLAAPGGGAAIVVQEDDANVLSGLQTLNLEGAGDQITDEGSGKATVDLKRLSAPDYDSGWFSVSTGNTYTKNHGLGEKPGLVMVWWRSGGGQENTANFHHDGTNDGVPGIESNSTSIKAKTGSNYTRHSRFGSNTGGTYKILAWKGAGL